MNRKHRITTALIALVVAVSFAALATPVAAQSVDNIQTTLSDTDGDDLDDQVQVDVTVSNVGSGQTTVELGETNFDVDVSPTDTADGNQEQFVTPQDPDGDGTNEAVEFVGIGTTSATYTITADLSNQADGEDGDVDVELGGGTTDSATYTVQQQQQQTGTLTVITGTQGDNVVTIDQTGNQVASGTTGPNGEVILTIPANTPVDVVVNSINEATASVLPGGSATIDLTGPGGAATITVNTGSQGDTVSAIDPNGATDDSQTTGPNGQAVLTVDAANSPFDILVNGVEERPALAVEAGDAIAIDLTLPTTQDPTNADGNRIVGGPGGNTGTVFLGEDDIALNSGIFRGVSAGQFTDADDNILTIDNGVVEQSNAISTYEIDTDGDGAADRVLDVREARVQSLFVIDARSQERLDDVDEASIEQPGRGDPFNVQFAVDYNYFESTSIDEELTQDGAEVTNIYQDSSLDSSLDPGGPFQSLDEDRRTYDALFNFNIDDTGDYTFTAEPNTGDERDTPPRDDGRDVGFAFREDASASEVITIIDDEDIEINLDSGSGNQGDRIGYEIVGMLEGEAATVTIEKDDLRYTDYGNFNEIVARNADDGLLIGGDTPIEFSQRAFRQTDELENHGLILRVGNFARARQQEANPDPLALDNVADQNEFLIFNTANPANTVVYNTEGEDVTRSLSSDSPGNTLDLSRTGPNGDLDEFSDSLNGASVLTFDRAYGVVRRDDGQARSQIDLEKLDDKSVEVEAFGDFEGEGIDADPSIRGLASTAGEPGLGTILRGVFRSPNAIRDDDDNEDVDVDEAGLTIDSPSGEYVPGTEVDLSGSISGAVDDVEFFVRNRDDYFRVTIEATDRADSSYNEDDFELSEEAETEDARDIVGQPGVYRWGVIDGIDVDIAQMVTADNVRGEGDDAGLETSDFNQGASEQTALRVVAPSLEGGFETFDGRIYQPDGIDANGTLIGPREYIIFFADNRGNTKVEQFTADDDDGEIDEEDLDLSGLRDGTVTASILSHGRDKSLGDGSFRISDSLQRATGLPASPDATLDNFELIAETLGEIDRTRRQVRDILLDQTVQQAGSDDLIVGQEFRLSDDSQTEITDIVPQQLEDRLTGVHPIEVGETMVVRGRTNRNPEDATVVVESTDGPSTAELGTGVADEWDTDAVWQTELTVSEEVEPGEYVIRSDDGERIDEETVEIVGEGTLEEGERLENELSELQNIVQELRDEVESLEGERDQLQQQVSDLEQSNSELQSELESTQQELEQTEQELEEARQNQTTDGQQDGQQDGEEDTGEEDTGEEDTGEEEEEEQPGFTAVAALVALIAVALLALRRREE